MTEVWLWRNPRRLSLLVLTACIAKHGDWIDHGRQAIYARGRHEYLYSAEHCSSGCRCSRGGKDSGRVVSISPVQQKDAEK